MEVAATPQGPKLGSRVRIDTGAAGAVTGLIEQAKAGTLSQSGAADTEGLRV